MKLYSVNDKEFSKYGKVLELNCEEIITEAEKIKMPDEGSVYEASVPDFEKLKIKEVFQNEIFGEIPIQTGYCYGHSQSLNALEWHKNSEVNVAVTDVVLFLGTLFELEDGNKFNSDNIKAFLVKKGQAIEVYGTTLHFCPCETADSGFGCVVVLPEGTNTVLENVPSDKLLFRKNKWLIAHEKNTELINKGVVSGIYGKNLNVNEDLD